jgi:hypothetical protein
MDREGVYVKKNRKLAREPNQNWKEGIAASSAER